MYMDWNLLGWFRGVCHFFSSRESLLQSLNGNPFSCYDYELNQESNYSINERAKIPPTSRMKSFSFQLSEKFAIRLVRLKGFAFQIEVTHVLSRSEQKKISKMRFHLAHASAQNATAARENNKNKKLFPLGF